MSFSFPIRIKRIANGEKVFVPGDGRDDVEVKLVEDNTDCKSPLLALHELLDAYEKEVRKARKKARRDRKVLTPGVLSADGS